MCIPKHTISLQHTFWKDGSEIRGDPSSSTHTRPLIAACTLAPGSLTPSSHLRGHPHSDAHTLSVNICAPYMLYLSFKKETAFSKQLVGLLYTHYYKFRVFMKYSCFNTVKMLVKVKITSAYKLHTKAC